MNITHEKKTKYYIFLILLATAILTALIALNLFVSPISNVLAEEEFTVSYSDNAPETELAVPSDGNKYADGDDVIVSKERLIRDYYTFVGWNIDPNADFALEHFTINRNVTIYAIWSENVILGAVVRGFEEVYQKDKNFYPVVEGVQEGDLVEYKYDFSEGFSSFLEPLTSAGEYVFTARITRNNYRIFEQSAYCTIKKADVDFSGLHLTQSYVYDTLEHYITFLESEYPDGVIGIDIPSSEVQVGDYDKTLLIKFDDRNYNSPDSIQAKLCIVYDVLYRYGAKPATLKNAEGIPNGTMIEIEEVKADKDYSEKIPEGKKADSCYKLNLVYLADKSPAEYSGLYELSFEVKEKTDATTELLVVYENGESEVKQATIANGVITVSDLKGLGYFCILKKGFTVSKYWWIALVVIFSVALLLAVLFALWYYDKIRLPITSDEEFREKAHSFFKRKKKE